MRCSNRTAKHTIGPNVSTWVIFTAATAKRVATAAVCTCDVARSGEHVIINRAVWVYWRTRELWLRRNRRGIASVILLHEIRMLFLVCRRTSHPLHLNGAIDLIGRNSSPFASLGRSHLRHEWMQKCRVARHLWRDDLTALKAGNIGTVVTGPFVNSVADSHSNIFGLQ